MGCFSDQPCVLFSILVASSDPLVPSSFLLLVAMPGATSSVLAPRSDALCSWMLQVLFLICKRCVGRSSQIYWPFPWSHLVREETLSLDVAVS